MLKVEGKLYKILDFIYNMIFLNLITAISSLGIITLGASIGSALAVCINFIEKKELYVKGIFIKNFKKNFKQSTIITVIYLLFFMLLNYRIELITTNKIFIFLNYFLKVHITITFFMSLIILQRHKLKISQIIKGALIIVNKNLYIILPFLILPFINMTFVKYQFFLFICTGLGITVLIITYDIFFIYKKYEKDLDELSKVSE